MLSSNIFIFMELLLLFRSCMVTMFGIGIIFQTRYNICVIFIYISSSYKPSRVIPESNKNPYIFQNNYTQTHSHINSHTSSKTKTQLNLRAIFSGVTVTGCTYLEKLDFLCMESLRLCELREKIP